ncbi:MAG TPA: acyltransferase domain-containing protein [Mycobacteriales bacterium]|nr:acyltransferase domain-containing protein [Mycobacteriales bacterium]
MLAILAPGQGTQTPGFLSPWIDLPSLRRRLDWASYVCGLDLVRLGTTGSDEEIRDTATCQPLLVAAGLAALHELDVRADVVAGHSAGEITALAAAGAIGDDAACILATERGAAMAGAAALSPTGLAALVGGDPDAAAVAVEAAGLHIATVNGAGQLVAGGDLRLLEEFSRQPPAGVRVRMLRVAGAFHTAAMSPAADRFERVIAALPVDDPHTPWISDLDGTVVAAGRDVGTRLLRLLVSPVRFDLVLETLDALGVTAVIEVLPGGTLTGLVRRALPHVESVALRTPGDLVAARALVAAHQAQPPTQLLPWRLVVSPLGGRFTSAPVEQVAAGDALGLVTGRRDEVPVLAGHAGTVVEWLAADGDPVRPGQPLVRLHPAGDL